MSHWFYFSSDLPNTAREKPFWDLERFWTLSFTLFPAVGNISRSRPPEKQNNTELSYVERLRLVYIFFSPIWPIPSVQQPIPAAALLVWDGLCLICIAVWLLIHYIQMARGPMNKVMAELEENTMETNCLCLLWNQVASITMSWGCRGMENEFPEGID